MGVLKSDIDTAKLYVSSFSWGILCRVMHYFKPIARK